MADMPWEHAAEARAALNAIVTDPEHGVAALSSPRTMSNLLKDLLPDAPREKNLLIAAADAGLAGTLSEHVAQGMDSSTAIRLTASSFSARSPLSPDACSWVTGEIAVAMGISETNQAAFGAGTAQQSNPSGPGATQVSPAYDGYLPGHSGSAERGDSAGQASRSPWQDSSGGPQDNYRRSGDSAPPAAAGFAGGSAVVSPGQGAASSYPQVPASQPPGQADYQQPGRGYSPPAPGYSPPAPGYSPPAPGYSPPAPDYSPPAPGYAPGSPGYMPPTAFSPAQNPQAYGPGVAPGMPAMPGYQPVPQPGIGRRTNTLAVTSLVLGLVQFVGWFIVLLPGLLAAILAIVLGFVAMKQVGRSGESGRGLAISGVVLGFLGIVVVGILIIVGYASVNGQS
jgi:hypothetical protein